MLNSEVKTMANAIYNGAMGRRDGENPFAEMPLPDMAARCLRRAGQTVDGSAHSIVNKALMSSDFPEVAARTITKAAGAIDAPGTFESWTDTGYNLNFHDSASAWMSAGGPLPEIGAGGEIPPGNNPVQGAEIGRVRSFGERFSINRRVFVDDDRQQLFDFGAWLKMRRNATIGHHAAAALEANGDLSDGTALFDASRGNLLTGAESAFDADALNTATAALWALTDSSGVRYGLQPRLLIVPTALEAAAAAVLRTLAAADRDRLQLIVEPNLTDSSAWYVSDSPRVAPVVRILGIAGQQLQPTVSSKVNLAGDSVEFRALMDFGVVVVSDRMVKSAGE